MLNDGALILYETFESESQNRWSVIWTQRITTKLQFLGDCGSSRSGIYIMKQQQAIYSYRTEILVSTAIRHGLKNDDYASYTFSSNTIAIITAQYVVNISINLLNSGKLNWPVDLYQDVLLHSECLSGRLWLISFLDKRRETNYRYTTHRLVDLPITATPEAHPLDWGDQIKSCRGNIQTTLNLTKFLLIWNPREFRGNSLNSFIVDTVPVNGLASISTTPSADNGKQGCTCSTSTGINQSEALSKQFGFIYECMSITIGVFQLAFGDRWIPRTNGQ